MDVVPSEITSGLTVYRHMTERNHDYYVPSRFPLDNPPPEHMWRRCPSKDHVGKAYFANKATGRSEWTLPDIESAKDGATGQAAAAEPMIAKVEAAADAPSLSNARLSIQESIRQRLAARMGKDPSAAPPAAAGGPQLSATKSEALHVVVPPSAQSAESPASPSIVIPSPAVATDEEKGAGGGGGVRDKIAAWRAGRGAGGHRSQTPQPQGDVKPSSPHVSPTKGINLAAVESDAQRRESSAPAVAPARARELTPVSTRAAQPSPAVQQQSTAPPALDLADGIAKDIYEEKRRQMIEADEALQREKEALLRQERANAERMRLLNEQRLKEEEAYAKLVESRRRMEQRRLELEKQQMEHAMHLLGRAREVQMLHDACDTVDQFQQAHEQMTYAAEAEKARAVSFSEAISRSLVDAAVMSSDADSPPRKKNVNPQSPQSQRTRDEEVVDNELSVLQQSLLANSHHSKSTAQPRQKVETITYGPSLTYIGEVTVSSRGGLPSKNGRGQMYYDKSKSTFYDGQWSNDEKSGFGVMSLPNSHFEGDWRKNKLHGRSTMQTQKLRASLQLKAGQPTGNAIVEVSSGETFAGRIASGGDKQQIVFGTLRLTSSDVVEWMWEDAKTAGSGDARVQFASGDSFVGAVQNYFLHGRGAYHFVEGHEYIGEFERGSITGRGLFRFQNGNVYEGTLKNGVFHGQGKYSHQQEYVYEGEWCEGKMHGKGTVKYRNGDVWEGLLENDKRAKGRYVASKQFQLPVVV